MSALGNRLIDMAGGAGYQPGDVSPFRVVSADQLNEFRRELIELRRLDHGLRCLGESCPSPGHAVMDLRG